MACHCLRHEEGSEGRRHEQDEGDDVLPLRPDDGRAVVLRDAEDEAAEQSPPAEPLRLAVFGEPGAVPAGELPRASEVEGLAQREFRVPKCRACGDWNWIPYPACRTCLSEDLEWRRDNNGRVLERLFNVNVYYKAYRKQRLDQASVQG